MQYWLLIFLTFFLKSCTTHDAAQQRGYVITQSHVEPDSREEPALGTDQP